MTGTCRGWGGGYKTGESVFPFNFREVCELPWWGGGKSLERMPKN